MTAILLSAVLFGFVHPGAKLLLGSGLDLAPFCFLYVGFRVVMQLPLVMKRKGLTVSGPRNLALLLLIGFVGAALQVSEFVGLTKGLPVPLVSFLVYSHPVWSTLLTATLNRERLTGLDAMKVALGLAGLFLISGTEFAALHFPLRALLGPILASLLIATWVSLANVAKRNGLATITIAFYYDVFALGALAVFLAQAHGGPKEILNWLSAPSHFLAIVAYSFFIGVLPNLLFYSGSATVGARTAGLILLIEPVTSSLVSGFFWAEPLARLFYIGTGLVLSAAVPDSIWMLVVARLQSRVIGAFSIFQAKMPKRKPIHINSRLEELEP